MTTPATSRDGQDSLACPQCLTVVARHDAPCPACGCSLAWLDAAHDFRAALAAALPGRRAERTAPATDADAPPVGSSPSRAIPLDVGSRLILGRQVSEDPRNIQLADPGVDLHHALITRQPGTRHYWLADLGSRGGTFVNRRRIVVRRLEAGDLVQIGPFAWNFSREDGWLVPADAIQGVELRLEGVGVRGRLQPLDLRIPRGQLVAVIGPSGAGKSTLLKAILAAPGVPARGTIRADGVDITTARAWYRGLLGYVSQQPVVHAELTARQAVRFAALFRRGAVTEPAIDDVLHQVELPRARWNAPPHSLSGGEASRVRTATQLIGQPRLLLLDEPTSGLDAKTEANLLLLLRNLALRGCTVLVITHGLKPLDLFDRVLAVIAGRLRFDGTPEDLRRQIPSGDLNDLDFARIADSPPAPLSSIEPPVGAPPAHSTSYWSQCRYLLAREGRIVWNDRVRRLVLPVAVVPSLFAMAVHLAVPADHRSMLGFLSLLATIWMGASLGLMAIVSEREVVEHERLLFLRLVPYIAARMAMLCGLSLIQTLLFLSLLRIVRDWQGVGGMLLGPPWVALTLALVGCAAVGLGLLISALANRSKPAANFVLPLVMMAQILFSVQVAGQGQADLAQAYGEFHLHACQGDAGCRRRVQYWIPGEGGWLCDDCRAARRRGTTKRRRPAPVEVAYENARRPPDWAAALSYVTLSRYADIALRSFAYHDDDHRAFSGEPTTDSQARYAYRTWRCEAWGFLAILTAAFPALTLAVMWCQSFAGEESGVRLPSRWRAAGSG